MCIEMAKAIFLSRQARDKHTQEKFTGKSAFYAGVHPDPDEDLHRRAEHIPPRVSRRVCGCHRGAKNASFAPFYTKNNHFTKTGSGQT
jgi:hypothetical protein